MLKSAKENDRKIQLILCSVFGAVLLLFFLFYERLFGGNAETNSRIADIIILLGISAGAFILRRSYFPDRISARDVIIAAAVCGFALRLAYAVKFNYNVNQHDVESLNTAGHLSYIDMLSKGEGLPKTNDWQFSHPPLHHVIAAVSVWLSRKICVTGAAAFENIQYLSVLYSVLIMNVSYKIFKECGLRGRNLAVSFSLVAFYPQFFILSGSINNDTLSILLSLLVILYTVRWYKHPSVKYSLIIGAFAGLGMMTKFSVAVFAAAVAVCVFIRFSTSRDFKLKSLVIQALCFLAVMLPLGLWYQIRNLLLFGQPIGYVAPLSTASSLYIGNISLTERLLLPFSTVRTGIYVDVWHEHNLWQYLLRNSLFGEYKFGNEGIAVFAVLCNILLVIATVVSIVLIIKRKKADGVFVSVCVFTVFEWIAFLYLNISSPFRCSMDFRYIVPVAVTGIYILGHDGGILSASKMKHKIFSEVITVISVVFAVSSVAVFL